MIIFTRKDIERWSTFSGDNNKLHYAPSLGKCVVQGMFIFVWLLNKITTLESDKQEAINFEVFFRKEVYTDVHLYVKYIRDNGISIEGIAKDKLITAKMHCDLNGLTRSNTSEMEHIRVEGDMLKKYSIDFFRVFPKHAPNLVFYSALCFSVGLCSKTFLTYRDDCFKTPGDFFDNYIVKHTSQKLDWHNPFRNKKPVNPTNLIDIFITENKTIFLSGNVVARSLFYVLQVDGIEYLRLKSVFLIKSNEASNE